MQAIGKGIFHICVVQYANPLNYFHIINKIASFINNCIDIYM